MTPSGLTGLTLTDAVEEYLAAALVGDRHTAVNVALGLLASGEDPEAIITDVLANAQARIGRGWQDGVWSVAQEHRASAIAEAALQAVADTAMRTPGAIPEGSAGRAVVACSEGEWHVLPGRMASEILRLRGVEVAFIGPSIPADLLVEMFEFDPPTAVAITCSMPMSLVGSWASASALRELGMYVLCGGRGYGRDGMWSAAVGADYWAPTFADGADRLMAALAGPRPGPRPPMGSDQIAGELSLLRQEGPAAVENAMSLALNTWPWLRESGAAVRATRTDLLATLQSAQSAALVEDITLLAEFVQWFESVLTARELPLSFVASAFDLLLEVVPTEFPLVRSALLDGLGICSEPPLAR